MVKTLLLGGWLALVPVVGAAQVVGSIVEDDDAEVLSISQREEVDAAVERGLDWLASQQQRDGSFPTLPQGQPGVTSLCVLAFLAHGHLPGEGKHGRAIERAIDYVIKCQKPSGLVALVAPRDAKINRVVGHEIGVTVVYNHAMGALALCEAYALDGTDRARQLEPTIERALAATLEMQNWPKDVADDEGGWRYLDDYDDRDSDLSVTGWQLMLLRSAKNAGFDVADEPIERAIGYVRRTFRPELEAFSYKTGPDYRVSRGMSGAGVLALAHAGLHGTPEARQAGNWILQNGFEEYNGTGQLRGYDRQHDRYHYGLLTCCQAMYQLGGTSWREFYPPTVEAVLSGQSSDGSWPMENHFRDARYGSVYTSAVCVLALGAPNQLLPVFQR